jgi:site-specific DNA recombinase
MNLAIGYIRVSTEGQASEGVSLEAQKAKIASWCELNGYELGAVHVDAGISGGKMANRPGLALALDEACEKHAALVVYSLSRLARSTKDAISILERLNKAKADLVSLSESIDTTTACGKMVFGMMAVLAEFERNQVSERTTAALAHKKSLGQRVGGLPYGYRVGPDGFTLEDDPEEMRIRAMVRAYRERGMSLRDIRDALAKEGIENRNGSTNWRLNTLGDIVR